MEQIAMAEQSKANTDSLSSEFSSVGGAVPTSPIGYIGNSRGRIAEVVRGAAPTSPPQHADECPSQTFEGASSPGVTLDPTTCVCHRAAPTSTPLDALIADWRKRATQWEGCEATNTEAEQMIVDERVWMLEKCADELEAALAASPASALVAPRKENT
jgi:hypothetical protein